MDQARIELTDLSVWIGPAVLLVCHLLARSYCPWLPVANAGIVEDMGVCVCGAATVVSVRLDYSSRIVDWAVKGRERELGFHAADQNVYVFTLFLAKILGVACVRADGIHPSICSALNSAKLGLFLGMFMVPRGPCSPLAHSHFA